MTQTALATARTQDGSELGALAELAADGFGGAVTRVQELHEAVARPRRSGPGRRRLGRVQRAAHDAIAGADLRAASVARHAAGCGRRPRRPRRRGGPRASLTKPRGRLAQGALNGFWGDRLEAAASDAGRADGDAAPTAATWRQDARALCRAPSRRAAARPSSSSTGCAKATPRGRSARRARAAPTQRGCCAPWSGHGGDHPLQHGLRVSENGRRLAALLEALVDAWPVPVRAASRSSATRWAVW